jgi:hypothetical protein
METGFNVTSGSENQKVTEKVLNFHQQAIDIIFGSEATRFACVQQNFHKGLGSSLKKWKPEPSQAGPKPQF